MADKNIILHEPISTDVLQLTINYDNGTVASMSATSVGRTTPSGTSASDQVMKTGAQLTPSLRTALENLLAELALEIADANGY